MGLWRKRPDPTIEALVGQIKAAAEAVGIAVDLLGGKISTEDAIEKIEAVETRGDEARAKLIEQLTQALGPPIDHEDMFRVSRSVDDVLDSLRDFVLEIKIFGAQDLALLRPSLGPIGASLVDLEAAVKALDDDPKAVTNLGFKAQKTAGRVRENYQSSLGELFSRDEVTVDMLRSRELLRRLDVIGLRLQEATAALSDGLMKRGLT